MKKETFRDFYLKRVWFYSKLLIVWTIALFGFSYINPDKVTPDPVTIFSTISLFLGLVWFLLIGGLIILYIFYRDFNRNIIKYDLNK